MLADNGLVIIKALASFERGRAEITNTFHSDFSERSNNLWRNIYLLQYTGSVNWRRWFVSEDLLVERDLQGGVSEPIQMQVSDVVFLPERRTLLLGLLLHDQHGLHLDSAGEDLVPGRGTKSACEAPEAVNWRSPINRSTMTEKSLLVLGWGRV